ncbi:MAG: hypothetical protein PHY23_00450 [Oscillospiraceae bacterium]|nr:hypothetical protein [Oscillospiraceae bacterium]
MKFSEKLNKLLALTEIQGAQLAEAVNIDPSQISRMRTGVRKRPKDTELLKLMANFLAGHCTGQYRLSSLAELTGDVRVQIKRSEHMSADAIFTWLSSDADVEPKTRVETFLRRFDGFSLRTLNMVHGETDAVPSIQNANGENGFYAFFDNAGKRRAVSELIKVILDSEEPGDVYLFTDEDMTWLAEDLTFLRNLTDGIQQFVQKGGHIYRVEPPMQSLDFTFRTIERWLPAHMSGAIDQYYYPHLRDELHRRTLFVAPGKAAVFSRSLAGQKQSRFTTFCADAAMVELCHQEALDILKVCRPMMCVHTVKEADALFACMRHVADIPADGLYKTASLSVATLPIEIMERVCRERNSPLAERMLKSQRERAVLRENAMQKHNLVDIMTLADPQEVMAGMVPVAITKMLPDGPAFYTPEEYRLHLERIVEAMERNYRYQVILTETPNWQDVILYCKGDDNVLLIKSRDPFAIFEITERRMATSFCDFLHQISAQERLTNDRQDTIDELRKMMKQLQG